MKLKNLEMALEKLNTFERPRADLEQYQTPAPVAARLLYHALMQGDLEDRSILDLGCGTGVLTCGAAMMGAVSVTGIDIDARAIQVAEANARRCGISATFITGDVSDQTLPLDGPFDTVIMNPPFGAQKKHADRPFIDRALLAGKVVYGIFNQGSLPFIQSYIEGRATIESVVAAAFPIKKTFSFHKERIREIPVEIVLLRRIEA
ncbi:METTL5 family protein [Methanosphaerula palustris]|uniref:Methyltransferase-like protein 5 n=1 Tax=Methanosphaerula palustris (strain ATCC BAA-1556 / DSM 19958 / E1-9c) TaxID=521011 RepID=B8GDN0_METPE|nr:METTL5 family protein [Methanosphaerula palustris]ACL17381.1 methyltransferase small [Methanosphaerula palustris E1-9c]